MRRPSRLIGAAAAVAAFAFAIGTSLSLAASSALPGYSGAEASLPNSFPAPQMVPLALDGR